MEASRTETTLCTRSFAHKLPASKAVRELPKPKTQGLTTKEHTGGGGGGGNTMISPPCMAPGFTMCSGIPFGFREYVTTEQLAPQAAYAITGAKTNP